MIPKLVVSVKLFVLIPVNAYNQELAPKSYLFEKIFNMALINYINKGMHYLSLIYESITVFCFCYLSKWAQG